MKKTMSRIAAILCVILLTLAPVSAHAEQLPEAGSEEFFEMRMLIARVIERTLPERASYIARLGLADIIINRTQDARFPDDIRSVVYERGEFECVAREDFLRTRPSYLSLAAARDALLGCDVTSGAVYFRAARRAEVPDGCFYHSGYVFEREIVNTEQ